jgi:2-dehydropantoate 2-reductase
LQSSTSNLKPSERLSFLVFGAGAIGTYFGGSLVLAGHKVVFVEQPKMVSELREHGLRLELPADKKSKTQEAFIVKPDSFSVEPSLEQALKFGPFDVALFALKSFDTAAALEGMKPFADQLPPILCLSNGIDNEKMIASALGPDKVIYGTVTSAIGRRGSGQIVLDKMRGMGVGAGHPLSERLVAVMNEAHLNCRLYPSPLGMKWSKMMLNLVANPTSAILNMTVSEIFANHKLYKLEVDMLKECLAVMKAQNLELCDLPGTPVSVLKLVAKVPLWLSKPFLSRAAGGGRGAKMPSFHIDLHAGRGKSEVEYLHGAVVREGKKYNVPTPVNELLTNTLLALTNKEIPLNEYERQPEKLLRKLEQ